MCFGNAAIQSMDTMHLNFKHTGNKQQQQQKAKCTVYLLPQVISINTVHYKNSFLFWKTTANIVPQRSKDTMNVITANLLSRLHLNSWHLDKQRSSQKFNCFFSLGFEKTTVTSEFCPNLHADKHCRNVILDMTWSCSGKLTKNLILEMYSKNRISSSSYNCTHLRKQIVKIYLSHW